MSPTLQFIIVTVLLLCAAAYASWRIYKALTAKGDACYGCPLKDACDKKKKN